MQVSYFFTEILETFYKNKDLKTGLYNKQQTALCYLLCVSHFLHPLVILHFTNIPTTMIMKQYNNHIIFSEMLF